MHTSCSLVRKGQEPEIVETQISQHFLVEEQVGTDKKSRSCDEQSEALRSNEPVEALRSNEPVEALRSNEPVDALKEPIRHNDLPQNSVLEEVLRNNEKWKDVTNIVQNIGQALWNMEQQEDIRNNTDQQEAIRNNKQPEDFHNNEQQEVLSKTEQQEDLRPSEQQDALRNNKQQEFLMNNEEYETIKDNEQKKGIKKNVQQEALRNTQERVLRYTEQQRVILSNLQQQDIRITRSTVRQEALTNIEQKNAFRSEQEDAEEEMLEKNKQEETGTELEILKLKSSEEKYQGNDCSGPYAKSATFPIIIHQQTITRSNTNAEDQIKVL